MLAVDDKEKPVPSADGLWSLSTSHACSASQRDLFLILLHAYDLLFSLSPLCIHPVLQTSSPSFQTGSHCYFSPFTTSCHSLRLHTPHLVPFAPLLYCSVTSLIRTHFPFQFHLHHPSICSQPQPCLPPPQLLTTLPASQVAFEAPFHPSYIQAATEPSKKKKVSSFKNDLPTQGPLPMAARGVRYWRWVPLLGGRY